MAEPLDLSPDLKLPIEVAGQVVAVVGIRESGKTNTAGVLAEELLDRHHPVVVIDPTDASWGLRSGYPIFIFGGPHGDIPLAETDGKGIAEFVVAERVPLILSLRHLRKAAQRRFVAEFCEELYHLKGKEAHRAPLTVMIDEAPLFVPQRVMGESARVVGAVEDLCARGRNTGFGVVLVTQRPATVNKDVLSQADTIIAHRLISPQDRKALGEWLEENASAEDLKRILASLAGMPAGQAWVWAPRLNIMRQVQVRKRRTFDSSATPSIGTVVAPPRRLQEVDLARLQAKLAATVARAKAEDPKALRAELAAVKAELAKAKTSATPMTERRVEVPVLTDAQVRRLEAMIARAVQLHERAVSGLQPVVEAAHGLTAAIRAMRSSPLHALPPGVKSPPAIALGRPSPVVPSGRDRAPSARLPAGEYRILTAIAQHADGVTREQLTVLTGYKRSTRDAYIQRLRERGHLDVAGDTIRSTEAGVRALGDTFEPLPTGVALREHWLARLPQGERVVLQALVEVYPQAIARDALNERTGFKRSTRDAYLQRLQARRLVELASRGEIRASEVLFS